MTENEKLYKKTLLELIDDLYKIFSENASVKKCFDVKDKIDCTKHQKYLLSVIKNKKPMLLSRDDKFFTDSNCKLIPSIDFSILWQDLTNDQKKVIWQYTLALYMIATDENKEDKKEMNNIVESMKDIKTEIDENSQVNSQVNVQNPPDPMAHFNSMFGDENSPILQMAKELAEETMKNPNSINQEELMQCMATGDMSKMGGLFDSVKSKVEEKLKSKDTDQGALESSAKEIMEKMNSDKSPMSDLFKNIQENINK